MGVRQVPSRLDPELRGFLQDLRNEVGRVGGDGFKLVLLGDMRTALSSDFLQPGDVTRIVQAAQDEIRNDPFWQFLGDKINLIDGPPTLPGSIQARLDTAQDTVENLMAEADAQLQTAIDANGSAIVTLQTVTAGQATQITALGSRMGDSESKVAMLMSTTPTDALWWTGLSTDVANTKNSVAMLMSTTPDGALWWAGLKSQADDATSKISMLMSSTPTGASWWAGLSTDTANSKSNIAMLMSTTPTGASWWSGLKTQVDNNSSQIVTLNTTTSNQAQSIQQLSNTTDGNTASIEVLQTVNNGLTAQYSVKLDVNGRVVGFGLYNQPSGSAFYVRADKFAVGDPSTGDRIPFIVSGGNVYIDTAFIINASIDSAKIADAAITSAKIGNYIASGSFNGDANNPGGNPGSSGWCINKNGDAAFNSVCVRTRSIENGAVTYQAMAGVGLSGAGASNNYWFNCEAGAQITATLLLNAESNDCPVASRINVAGPYPNFTTTSVLNTLGGGLYGYLSMSSSMGGSSEKFINTPGGRNVGIAMAIQFTADHTGSFYINVDFSNWGSCGNLFGYLTVVQGKR